MIVFSCTLVWLIYRLDGIDKRKTYVYPKTKHKYYAKGIVKMKDNSSGEWVDAVLYISLKNGLYYVRDKRDFFDKFVTLKEWEKNNDKSKGC